jgi:hypothetical protein
MFMSNGFNGISIADISNLKDPKIISSLEMGFPRRLYYFQNKKLPFLIVALELGVAIVNITNPF